MAAVALGAVALAAWTFAGLVVSLTVVRATARRDRQVPSEAGR